MRPFPRLETRRTALGLSVFLAEAVEAGGVILEFVGPLRAASELHDSYVIDHSIQVGPDAHMGPSGGNDDYVNHSCDPNAGVRITDGRVWLVALRPLAAGEEVTYDYSTTMMRNPWPMGGCRCGASACRGSVGDFSGLPSCLRERYLSLNIVPDYILLEDPALMTA